MPKISIIIPVYNVEAYLPHTIESILAQTYKDFELILVNDGSGDKSGQICDAYAAKDDRIKVIHQKNQGVSVARNLGIDLSTGDWITFVDGDDWLEEEMCQFALEKTQGRQLDMVMWSAYKSYIDREYPISPLSGGDQEDLTDRELLELRSIYAAYDNNQISGAVSSGTVWGKLYRRGFLEETSIRFKEELTRAQDTVFALEAFEKAGHIAFYDRALYHYRITNSSTCSGTRFIEDSTKPFDALLKEFSDFIVKYGKGQEFYRAFYARTIQVLLWHLNHNYFHEFNRMGLAEKRRGILELIDREPYKSALEKADYNLMSKKQRLMVRMFKRKLVLGFYLIFKLHLKYEARVSNKFD